MNPNAIRALIRGVLQVSGWWSTNMEELAIGTIAHESELGQYRRQIGGGPARGICQMEPPTEADIWSNFLAYRVDDQNIIKTVTGVNGPDPDGALINNLAYQILMMRLKYMQVPELIPDSKDIHGQALYWHEHYNGNPDVDPMVYVTSYQRLVLGLTVPA